MDDRLSTPSVLAHFDQGHVALPWKAPEFSGFMAGIDFDQILELENAEEIIQGIEPQVMYFALKRAGLADSLDVMALLSPEQLTRCLDYEAWATDDQLDVAKAVDWLTPYGELGPHAMGERFKGLEEEYQIGLLDGLVRIYDEEEYEALPQSEQDLAIPLPCNTVRYRILSDDGKVAAFIEALITSLVDDADIGYPYMLLAHAAYQPTHEAQSLLAQFRKGRLEDEGFVSLEESQAIFARTNLSALESRARHIAGRGMRSGARSLAQSDDATPFLDRAVLAARNAGWNVDELYDVHRGLLFLANGLCAVARIEADDLAGLQKMLDQAQALVSLGLEHLAAEDPELGAILLKEFPAKVLFQAGIALVDRLRERFLFAIGERGWPEAAAISRLFAQRKWGAVLLALDGSYLDFLGHEHLETAKGLFNRFPLRPVAFRQSGIDKITFEPIRTIGQYRQWAARIEEMCHAIALGQMTKGRLEPAASHAMKH